MAEFIKEALVKDDFIEEINETVMKAMSYPTATFTYKIKPLTADDLKDVDKKFKDLDKELNATPEEPKEEWVWVTGYKGTEKDLKCRDYQYELGKLHSMPEGEKIEDCKSGFHMCLNLNEVFSYYKIGEGHRYFEVQAQVRKRDLDLYGKKDPTAGYLWYTMSDPIRDKLAAKSIILTRELTVDEVLAYTEGADWAPEYKQTAIEKGLTHARYDVETKILTELGYSEAFARYISEQGEYDAAVKVASQTDLSMDMKVLAIIRGL